LSRGSGSGGAPGLASEDAANGGIGMVTVAATKPWHPVQGPLEQQPKPSQVTPLDGATGRTGVALSSAVTAAATGLSWEIEAAAVAW